MPNPETPRPHLLGLGVAWTRVGYGVLALAVVALILFATVHPFLPATLATIPEGYRLMGTKTNGVLLNATPLGVVAVFLHVFSALAGLVWTLVDVVDRRKRFVWILPMFVCPLVFALHALPLALYLFVGRETIGHGEGVQ